MTTLDSIVRSYLISQGRNTLHGYLKIMKHAIDCLRNISLGYSVMNKTVKCRLDYKKSVALPDDCLVPIAAAWKNGDRMESYDIDSSIAVHHSHVEDGISGTLNGMFQPVIYQNYVTANRCYSIPCYNLGHNGSGYFTFNRKSRELQFSSDVDSSVDIYVYYRSSGFNPKSKSAIPELFALMVEAYIHWQLGRSKHGDASAETEARRMNFDREQAKTLQHLMPITASGIANAKARAFDFNKLAF